ncbi:MAG: HNH endonuclease [Deltaproteobacteria bacterium]|nr:HNH endonuclease [Deltaproteobacteria bacterium]MBW2047741.1 HNH endonuclease [Deltaproteobacteria bacterium]MBW2110384.1 HNH endonuclease [Deltaproteobacteria bacterium]MBW2354537.1 HNH endonuclease [Deltaproteobacteria bacterium]HDZ90081.1 HNH endonuclease [Deltaproteobacteria bacterium]
MDLGFADVSDADIRREKEKARRLRRTNWWNSRIDKGICHYCRRKVGRENLTMDHVVPLARGGQSRKGNLVPACKECNSRKKYLLPVEWEEYLKNFGHPDL